MNERKQKFLSIGRKKGFIKKTDDIEKMTMKKNVFSHLKQKINNNRIIVPIAITLTVLLTLILVYL